MTDDIPLRDYVDHIYAELQGEMDRRYAALDVRLESMNEFRRSLSDQAAQHVTRHEIAAMLETVDAAIARNTDRLADLEVRVITATEIVNRRRLDIGSILQFLSVLAAVAAVLVVALHP